MLNGRECVYTIIDDEPGQEPTVRFETDHTTSVMTLDQILGMAGRLGLEFHDTKSLLDAFDAALPELDRRDEDQPKGFSFWHGMPCSIMEFIERFEASEDGVVG